MRLYVAGINGMVGSAIAEASRAEGYEVLGRSSKELDFTDRVLTFREIEDLRPDYLIICAAKVGGIGANLSKPADFLSINLQIQTNLLDAAHFAGVEKVLFLGSSCIYPKLAAQPINEESLLTGVLEPTNEAYAIAKIAGIKLVESYRKQFDRKWISAMPTNLYGPKDNFNLETSHVLPALIHRFHLAKRTNVKTVEIWGDGTPLREFLHVEDLARACLILLEKHNDAIAVNIGSGQEISINNLAKLISQIVGFTGQISFNAQMPNGTPRKLLNSHRIMDLGWEPQINLVEGIESTYNWFLTNELDGVSQ
jgi:GDP-L-fucose synthase